MMSARRYMPPVLALLLGVQILNGSASAQIPAQGAISSKNMHWEANLPNLAGNSLDFFERRLPDGSFKRYAVAAAHGNGFDIIDVTNPTDPATVGRYVNDGGGVYYHPWVQVNPRRNIVAISMEDPAVSPDHNFSNGVEFIDISDVANPVQLGKVSGVGGPHTIRMIGDNHVYTTLPTHIIDYTDPRNPVDLGEQPVCGHEFFPDPNNPGRTYAGICGPVGKWAIIDTTDPAKPVLIHEERDLRIQYAHEVYPAPDSTFVAVADFRGGGQTWTACPGGGIHFYDISGKYIAGASMTNPERMGVWHAPFTGRAPVDPSGTHPLVPIPNWGSCTMHSFQFQPERSLITAGIYTGGTWIADPTAATVPGGDLYKPEFGGNPNRGLGATTWGNTTANFISEGDFVNASQWLPFDIPAARDHLFTNGLIRGVDVLHYAGPIPKKMSRLRIDASAPGGAVSGILDRYAVLTYEGWVNKPLAGQTVEIRSGGATVTATTAADGSFSADLGLSSGSHNVTVTWAGNDEFEVSSLTRQVSA
jgi:hypothetical protein